MFSALTTGRNTDKDVIRFSGCTENVFLQKLFHLLLTDYL